MRQQQAADLWSDEMQVLEKLNNVVVQSDLAKTMQMCSCTHCLQRAALQINVCFEADDGAQLKKLLKSYAAQKTLAKPVDREGNYLLHLLCRSGKQESALYMLYIIYIRVFSAVR